VSGVHRCDLCNLTNEPCPGIPVHCAEGDHCVSTVEVCALEWRGGENPGGHPYRCEDCGVDLRAAAVTG
jgi:hypothetical protein